MDLRRHHRVPFTESVVIIRKGSDVHIEGESQDISVGGMFVRVQQQEAFGAEITVHVHFPGEASAFALPAIVRWTSEGGMGIQFGLLGARETHAITELVAAHERAS